MEDLAQSPAASDQSLECPKCHSQREADVAECRKCGIVFAKYAQHQEIQEKLQLELERLEQESRQAVSELRRELIYRIVALPAALLLTPYATRLLPLLSLLPMLTHECGHAVAAWLTGYSAIPGIGQTEIAGDRHIWLALSLVGGALGYGSWRFWTTHRPVLAAACVAGILFHLYCISLPDVQAEALQIFGGDAGCFVLGALLMTTMYARHGSALYLNELRWGLLGIGVGGFMPTFALWSGPARDIPYGVREDGLETDPSRLVEWHGWTEQQMIHRYVTLAELCLVALAIVYVVGILRTIAEIRSYSFASVKELSPKPS